MPRDLAHRAAFESSGETYTRLLAEQGGEVAAEARAWLAELQVLRDAASADRRDAREEETLRIAKEALSSAKEANRIASQETEPSGLRNAANRRSFLQGHLARVRGWVAQKILTLPA
jgi:MoxR-like ATPase